MTPADILQSVKSRTKRLGIATADRHFRAIEQCFGGGFCPTKLFESATPEQWQKSLEEAESKLTYSTSGMAVKDIATGGLALTKGSILDFDCIITTTRKDRDGDVLESKGAKTDPMMPLLWQHTPMQPIGKLVAVTSHTNKNVSGRFAIADTELGRDAATLVEFGALRISHGFAPEEFEPLEEKNSGWHIRKFEIFEASLVSIPSNVDAIITAFSRDKLHSPLIKGWAAKKAQKGSKTRPVQIAAGVDLKELAERTQAVVDATAKQFEEIKESPCGCQKSVETKEPEQKSAIPKIEKMYGEFHLPGSYEQVQSDLYRGLHKTLLVAGLIDAHCCHYSYIVGTFDGYAIVCVEKGMERDTYRIAWTAEDGKAAWSGEPEPVEIEVTAEVVERAKDSLQRKYFAELAGSELATVKSAAQRINALSQSLEGQQEAREWAEALSGIL